MPNSGRKNEGSRSCARLRKDRSLPLQEILVVRRATRGLVDHEELNVEPHASVLAFAAGCGGGWLNFSLIPVSGTSFQLMLFNRRTHIPCWRCIVHRRKSMMRQGNIQTRNVSLTSTNVRVLVMQNARNGSMREVGSGEGAERSWRRRPEIGGSPPTPSQH